MLLLNVGLGFGFGDIEDWLSLSDDSKAGGNKDGLSED